MVAKRKALSCAVIFIRVFLVFSQNEVVNWNSSWTVANSLCELAGSRLTGEVTANKIDITDITTEGQACWIGAVSQHTPWFDVFTCKVVTEKDFIKKVSVQVNDNNRPVHHCFKECEQYRVFGLSKSTCYCFNNLQISGDLCQNVRVSTSSFDIYGESASTGIDQAAVLQYDTNSLNPRPIPYNGTGTGDCVAAILVPGESLYSRSSHKLLPCDTQLPYICNGQLMPGPVDWADAVLQCDVVLSSVHQGLYSMEVQRTTVAWTGISRRSDLHWTSDVTLNENSLFNCLAISMSANGEATISKKDCKEELPFLCKKGTLKTTTLKSTTLGETTSMVIRTDSATSTTVQTTTADETRTTVSLTTQTEKLTSKTTISPQPDTTSESTTDQYSSIFTSQTSDHSTSDWQITTMDTTYNTTNSTTEDLPYQSDSGYLLMLAAILAGIVLMVVIVVLCLIYKRERTRHLFTPAEKKQNADLIYSVVKRKKCHTKELRDILDSFSEKSDDPRYEMQMTEKLPSDFFVNNCYSPSDEEMPDDPSHWYRSSLLIQVVPDGQTHSLAITDLEPSTGLETGDDLYNHIIRNVHDGDFDPLGGDFGNTQRHATSDGGYSSLEDLKSWRP
ncbi:uncharacterized protein LOC133184119 [Saccostrea echinata]|uniref:uncharacterized protein LOC133184119 n=1 Tax=Saccostrea echinata TaxID=191078 RepID=UPI002A80FC3C|nr:uncharacterized protein LOC133184119 [Saccostrea echinata]